MDPFDKINWIKFDKIRVEAGSQELFKYKTNDITRKINDLELNLTSDAYLRESFSLSSPKFIGGNTSRVNLTGHFDTIAV